MRRATLAVLLALAGCGGPDAEAARQALDRFHAALNSGDLQAVDALLTREARQLRPPLGTARAFQSIVARHGRHVATDRCETGAASIDGRDFVTLACTSRFERASIAESVTLTDEAGGLKLFSYTYKAGGPP